MDDWFVTAMYLKETRFLLIVDTKFYFFGGI